MRGRLSDRVLSELIGLSLDRSTRPADPKSWQGHPVWRRLLAGLAGTELLPRTALGGLHGQHAGAMEPRRANTIVNRVQPRLPRMVRSVLAAAICGGGSLACILAATRLRVADAVMISLLAAALALVGGLMAQVDALLKLRELESRGLVGEISGGLMTKEDFLAAARQSKATQDKLSEQIDDRLSLLMSVPELFNLQRRRPSEAARIINAVRDATTFEMQALPLSMKFLSRETTSLTNLIRGLRTGYATQAGEALSWRLSLAEGCVSSIDGVTSGPSDTDDQYVEARRRAIVDRGVRARELFALSDHRFTDDRAFMQICERLQRAGVDVRYLTRDMCRPESFDQIDEFALFDNEISYETALSRLFELDRAHVM